MIKGLEAYEDLVDENKVNNFKEYYCLCCGAKWDNHKTDCVVKKQRHT